MDPNDRIEDLERQVRDLTELVHRLQAGGGTQTPSDASRESKPKGEVRTGHSARHAAKQVFKEDFRLNVDKVLGGEAGDTIETAIGSIWLSRLAVVLVMTAIVLGARVTLYTEVLGPFHKVLIVYAAAIGGIVCGIVWWRSKDFFSQTLLGAGLAGVYFATYSGFFVEGMRVFSGHALAPPLLLVCLALLVIVSHIRRSQTTAGVGLFLVYYTVVASCMGAKSSDDLVYALATSAALAVVALIFHARHRWLLFTWAALIATHLTYIYFFRQRPPDLDISDKAYFWLSNGFLAVCYVAFSLACIIDARKTGEYRRTVAPLAGVNSGVFFWLTWVAIRDQYLAEEWLFRLAFAGMLLTFAFLAETSGPRRNYLFQIFIAKAVVMFTLALQSYLSGEKLMVAMAVECLGLAFSYKRSGVVVFKALELGLLLVTFVGCLFHVKALGGVVVGSVSIPSNWFCCAGSAMVFIVVAWFYEQFVRRVKPEHRIVSGQWFLADSWLDVRSAAAAILHAAAASLILLTITIIDRGNDPRLPYLLAGEGVIVGLVGFLLRTPQVEVGGVLLLVASHVAYYAFLFMGLPGFEQQVAYVFYTVAVALFTYAGAYLWERYLRRLQGGKAWEHHVVAAVPYLAATFMLTTLIGRQLTGIQTCLAQNAVGLLLLLVGVVTAYPGVKASGVLAFGIGTVTCYRGLFSYGHPLQGEPYFLGHFGLLLVTYAMAERLFVILQHQERGPSPGEDVIRTGFVVVGAALGALGLHLDADLNYLTLYWLALAVVCVVLGAVFRESRYRWIAILLLLASIVRAFAFDLRKLAPIYAFLSFAALAAALLTVTWAYSRYRQRRLAANNMEAKREDTSNV